MKVFKSCSNWLYEFRLYRRDDKGRIVKANDHLMDDTRYMVMSGIKRMITKPKEEPVDEDFYHGDSEGGWMG
jgi:hypothetical protein